jgi:hypothetical protein
MLALVSDAKASIVNVELAQGNTFEVLHPLDSGTAYRHVEASPDFSSIVVAGYASQPRRWQLAWSSDSGDSWQEFAPEVVASSASALLMGLDPTDSDRVFFQVQGNDEMPAELWSFQRQTAAATQLLVLDLGHVVTGLAFVDDELWLSSKGPSGGGLYRANLQDTAAFEPVIADVPPLACLGTVNGEPFVCVDDYSTDSPFLLGKVNVDTKKFEPLLKIGDFGKLKDCSTACSGTHDWLDSVYGEVPDTDSDTSGDSNTSAATEPPPPSKDDGGCSMQTPRCSDVTPGLVVLSLLGIAAFVRRRIVA